MSKRDYIAACSLVACSALILSFAAHAATVQKKGNSCVDCHAGLPGSSFVGARSHAWKGSIHQKRGVTCDKCHGGDPRAFGQKEAHSGVLGSNNPQSSVYYKNIPSTCGKCHGAEFYKFSRSRHYQILESSGKGPECVTCHGSMVTSILTPDTIQSLCEKCHNDRMGIFPYVPKKAKAVLLLLRESTALLDADKKLYHLAERSAKAASLRDAQLSLHSARLDWHTFDLDSVIADLQITYNSLKKVSPESTQQGVRR